MKEKEKEKEMKWLFRRAKKKGGGQVGRLRNKNIEGEMLLFVYIYIK